MLSKRDGLERETASPHPLIRHCLFKDVGRMRESSRRVEHAALSERDKSEREMRER
jgi:hypothetical protein